MNTEKRKKNILLVEDEIPLQEAISDRLLGSGFNVITARSYEQVVSLLASLNDISLLWLDHHLIGEKSGLDVLAHVRSSDQWSRLPVFVVSNTFNPEVKEGYVSLGIHRHYDKAASRLELIVKGVQKVIAST